MLDIPDGEQREFVVGGLKPETTYVFTVSAYTRKGDGTQSRYKTARTKGASKRA